MLATKQVVSYKHIRQFEHRPNNGTYMSTVMTHEPVGLMEPMMPAEGNTELSNLVLDLIGESQRLAGMLHPKVQESVGDLVRSMNCYYSNFIEGHNTHPRDIDRALANDYSTEARKRSLQKEAVAHIQV